MAAAQNLATAQPTAVRRSPRGINVRKYQPDWKRELGKKDTRPQRIAHYLVWAAKEAPGEYTPLNMIVQAIFGFKNPPAMRSDQTEGIRACSQAVRKILQREYGRDLDQAAGGARATVDDEDVARTTIPKRARRLQSAKNAYVQSVDLVDERNVKDPALKAYLKRSVNEVMRLVNNEDFDRKLLPPSTTE